MAAYRILNQAPQYLLPDGSVNAGGMLYFYETDLSTPKDTWSDEGLTVLNSNPVLMDAAGRTVTDVWGDGEYGVVMADADDVVIWTRNNVQSGADPGLAIPALVNGQFLTNDDSVLLWQDILQVPDPTGLSNYILTSDGASAIWQPPTAIPDPPEPDITVSLTDVEFGGGGASNWLIQNGSGSATASGGKTATATVTYPTAYESAPNVMVNPTTASACGTANIIPSWAVTSKSATQFTVTFSTLTGGTSADNTSGSNIVNAVTFDWTANGTVTAP